MEEHEIEQIMEFLAAARVGKLGTASTGERSIYNLAKQAADLGWMLMDIDCGKREGFYKLLEALAYPDSREILLKQLPA